MDKRLTILVVSCDKYKDISDMYFQFLRINWPNCVFPLALATEECNCSDPSVQVIKCGKGVLWTKEVLLALEKIESQYILLTVDDLFISKKVRNQKIVDALNFVVDNKIKYYRIPKGIRSVRKKDLYPGQKYISKIRKDKVYSVTIGSAIWNKTELIKILGDGTKTAWELEDYFSQIAVSGVKGYYYKYVTDCRPLLQCAHMITAGKWIPQGIKTMKSKGFRINTSIRGQLSYREAGKMKIMGVATKLIPKNLRKPIKSVLSKFGFRFATKY